MEKLKQKVASSSSRVIASLQQAATGTFQPSTSASPSQQSGLAQAGAGASPTNTPTQQQQQQMKMQMQVQAQTQTQTPISIPISVPAQAQVPMAMPMPMPMQPLTLASAAPIEQLPSAVAGGSSAAKLMAAEATAHLTEQEREILLEVFRKEEQFQRDTIK